MDLVTGGTFALTNLSAANVAMDLVTGGTFALTNLSASNVALDLVTGGSLSMNLISSSIITAGTLNVTGDSILNGNLTTGALFVTGASSLIGALVVSTGSTFVTGITSGDLYVINDTILQGSLTVSGATVFAGDITAPSVFINNATIGNTFINYFTANEITTGTLNVNSGAYILGGTTTDTLVVDSGETVYNGSTIYGGATIDTLTVTGNTTLEGELVLNAPAVASTSPSSGSFVVSGGIGIQETQNAVNSANGGGLTVAGGAAVGLDTYLGSNFYSLGNTSNNLVSITGDLYINNVDLTPSYGDLFLEKTAALPTALSPTVIPGFAFDNAVVRSFDAIVSVSLNDLYTVYKILGVQKGNASSGGSWVINTQFAGDYISDIDLTINDNGQMLYSNGNATAGNMSFRALTTSINL